MTSHPCIDCGDPTLNPQRCRDCDIEYLLTSMQCSGCKRMRYTREAWLAPVAAELWGERCSCDPQPPSVREENQSNEDS